MNPAPAIDRILDYVKGEIKRRGLTYQDVGKALDLSVASVKRLLNSGQISLDKLAIIASLLNESLEAVLTAGSAPDNSRLRFTESQEAALAKNLPAFTYLMQLVDGDGPSKIERDTGISHASTRAYLRFLEDLELIEVHANDRIKFAFQRRRRLYLIPNGPLNAVLFEKRLARIQARITERGQPDVFRHPVEQGWLGRYMTFNLNTKQYLDLLSEISTLIDRTDQASAHARPDDPTYETVTMQCFVDRFDMYDGVMSPIGEFDAPR